MLNIIMIIHESDDMVSLIAEKNINADSRIELGSHSLYLIIF